MEIPVLHGVRNVRWLMALGLFSLAACGNCNPGTSDDDAGNGGGPLGNGGASGGVVHRDGGTGTSGGTSMGTSSGMTSGGSSGTSGNVSSGGASSGGVVVNCIDHELCEDGLDNNCNGVVNEGCTCTPGETRPCYDGEPAQAGIGVCTMGTITCEFAGEDTVWGACVGSGHPSEVICGGHMDYRCTGHVDEGCPCELGTTRPCYSGRAGTDGVGLCHGGVETCTQTPAGNQFGECANEVVPSAETCDGSDHDCDGTVNNGCSCVVGATQACYTGAAGTNGVGLCHGGMQTCLAGASGASWSDCAGQVTPSAELCDGQDYDCDGAANSGCGCVVGAMETCYSGPAGTNGVGLCHGGTRTCIAQGAGSTWTECMGEQTPQANACNGEDRMCNGMPSTGCACTLGATQGCYQGPPGTDGVGVCHGGTQSCALISGTIQWDSTCTNQVTPAATEVCGNGADDNCDGNVDEGCGGAIQCPGDQTVLAGQDLALTATSMGINNITWTITNGPSGGPGTVEWTPSNPTGPNVNFRAYIVGVYTVQVSGTDANGQTRTCSFNISALSHGLRVELTWDGTGDVDLHVHNATHSSWFGTSAGGDDCFYGLLTTGWGAGLDVDNVTANGPENIRIDNPAVGQPYYIGIHNYARAAGRRATVKVFCGTTGGVNPTATFTSRALNGTATGQATSNDFWRMANVTFNGDGSCNIVTQDQYTTGSFVYSNF